MPDGHCADPSLPLHLDQGRGSSKKESFSLRVSPALHPPERPSPRRVDMAGHGHGSGDAGTDGSAWGPASLKEEERRRQIRESG